MISKSDVGNLEKQQQEQQFFEVGKVERSTYWKDEICRNTRKRNSNFKYRR